jgi:hypothetical protein
MRAVGHRESDAILGAMRQVALAGGRPLSHADSASIAAAGHYLMRRGAMIDGGSLPAVEPADLVDALKGERELGQEAVKYLAVMALVDGALDHAKIARVLEYARALDIEAAYLTELVEAASGHMDWVIADMTHRNAESVVSGPWGNRGDPAAWIVPYGGANAQPELTARYEALGKLPDSTFGKAYWKFNKDNGYTFPGDPTALNAGFATPHDSTHVISGYDASPRGEILVSTFTAAMHPINPMAGHILPVIFNGHLGVKFNDVARYTTGGFDPDEFWHAWARGRETTVDIFSPSWNFWEWVEHDLEDVRRTFNVSPTGRPPQ